MSDTATSPTLTVRCAVKLCAVQISPVWYQLKAAAAAEGQQGFRFELVGGHDVDQGWMAELRKPVTVSACA
jgi:hypothetical protein